MLGWQLGAEEQARLHAAAEAAVNSSSGVLAQAGIATPCPAALLASVFTDANLCDHELSLQEFERGRQPLLVPLLPGVIVRSR